MSMKLYIFDNFCFVLGHHLLPPGSGFAAELPGGHILL